VNIVTGILKGGLSFSKNVI